MIKVIKKLLVLKKRGEKEEESLKKEEEEANKHLIILENIINVLVVNLGNKCLERKSMKMP